MKPNQNKTKRNEVKQNKSKRNETKRNNVQKLTLPKRITKIALVLTQNSLVLPAAYQVTLAIHYIADFGYSMLLIAILQPIGN